MEILLGRKYTPIEYEYKVLKPEYRDQVFARKECLSLIDQSFDEYKKKSDA